MHGGGLTLAERISAASENPDLFLVSSMCDLNVFIGALPRSLRSKPFVYYFHENQLTYPRSERDTDIRFQRDLHYGFIQIASAYAADEVWFNTALHRDQFLEAAEKYLRRMPDHRLSAAVAAIREKSKTVHLGLELSALRNNVNSPGRASSIPLLLWNHRWEYDKQPDVFFETLLRLADEGCAFKLAVLGESFGEHPPIFEQARMRLAQHIVHWGYCQSRTEYASWLNRAHLLPVTAVHDFFGISVVEAAACGVRPLLPRGLVYEEHFTDDGLFYERGKLYEAITVLLSGSGWREPYAQPELDRYDWKVMAPVYDLGFARLAGQSD